MHKLSSEIGGTSIAFSHLDNCRQISVIRYHIKNIDDQLIIKLSQD